MSDVSRETLAKIHWMWRHGDLSYLLHDNQIADREFLLTTKGRRKLLCCARRYGKSFFACVLAVETALRTPGAIIRYAAPTQAQVLEIIEPHMRTICRYAPGTLLPEYKNKKWVFHNGSYVVVVGCDDKDDRERLRGTSMHLGLIDEARDIKDLDYVVRSILTPQTMTTDGWILLLSSPATTPAHDFTGYVQDAEANGTLLHHTIYDAPHITPEIIEEYKAESGGENSTHWRREYLAEIVVDEESAVIPEFSQNRDVIVEPLTRPQYFVPHVSMDVGYHDMTVVLFGYYDFARAKVCIEDELVFRFQSSFDIIHEVKKKEKAIWEKHPVALRVVDAQDITVADLNRLHQDRNLIADNVFWIKARKDNKHAAVNAVRVLIHEDRLRIDPRCKSLIAHLSYAVWNRQKTDYERMGAYGHFDAVDALVYFVRHVNQAKNPAPQQLPTFAWKAPKETPIFGKTRTVKPRM